MKTSAISLEHLRFQYDYVVWADDRCCAAAATVPAERYHADVGISMGTVHKLLLHMLGAQHVWLRRFKENDPSPPFLKPEEVVTLDAIRERWGTVHADWRAFLAAATPDSLAGDVAVVRDGLNLRTPRLPTLLHVIDHATYHRAQLNSMIKLAGGTPGDYQFIRMLRDAIGAPA